MQGRRSFHCRDRSGACGTISMPLTGDTVLVSERWF
jgi:hypothetical protein